MAADVPGPDRRRPRRVRMSRARGWRKPPGVVYVGRPSRWGNPYREGDIVGLYRRHLSEHPELVAAARQELAGRDLACWCPLDQPCHADVLLEVANDTGGRERALLQ